MAAGAQASGDEAGARGPVEGLAVVVGRGAVDRERVDGVGAEQPAGEDHEAAAVTCVGDHPRARHRRQQGDGRHRRRRVHRGGEVHREGAVDGHRGRAVGRGEVPYRRRARAGQRPVVIERVRGTVKITDPRVEREAVARRRGEDGPPVLQGDTAGVLVPDQAAGCAGRGPCGVVEVAAGDRGIDVEPGDEGGLVDRVVEGDPHRGVGGDAGGAIARRQRDDLGR